MVYLSSEEVLVQRAKKGEREAFDELYQRYKRPILNYIYRFVGNRSHAEELTQEVFVRAYMNLDRFEMRPKFSSWVYRIAANASKNFLRTAYRQKRLIEPADDSQSATRPGTRLIERLEDPARKPDELAQQSESELLVQKAIKELPAHLKEALILCDIQGVSYEDAAKIMKCAPMTVGSRVSRARERLAKLLSFMKDGKDA